MYEVPVSHHLCNIIEKNKGASFASNLVFNALERKGERKGNLMSMPAYGDNSKEVPESILTIHFQNMRLVQKIKTKSLLSKTYGCSLSLLGTDGKSMNYVFWLHFRERNAQ